MNEWGWCGTGSQHSNGQGHSILRRAAGGESSGNERKDGRRRRPSRNGVYVWGGRFGKCSDLGFRVQTHRNASSMIGSASSKFFTSLLIPLRFKALSERCGGRKGRVHHSHSFDDSIDLMPPLRSFCLPLIEHDAMLNLLHSGESSHGSKKRSRLASR